MIDQCIIMQIEKSLKEIEEIADHVEMTFAARLLDTYPDVYRLFALDLEPQARKVVPTLKLIAHDLPRFGTLLPAVRALAYSRKVCRIIDSHYQPIGETLIWTLRRSLGDSFDSDVERAWHNVLLTR